MIANDIDNNRTNYIVYNDTLQVLPKVPSNSIPLIVTDPPYNSQISWGRKDNEWQFKWLTEAKRILKPGVHFTYFLHL